MYKLIEWNENLDLGYFYSKAYKKGFVNNSSQETMIDCFRNETNWNVWILYDDHTPIGSVASHTFDQIFDNNSFRVLTRVCTLTEHRPQKGLLTLNRMIKEHQHFSDQFFLPKCIEWTGLDSDIYATSNESKNASQQLVHKLYFPTLEKKGIVKNCGQYHYRGLEQTIWKINQEKFLDSLNSYPRWI